MGGNPAKEITPRGEVEFKVNFEALHVGDVELLLTSKSP
jgi:hypothetical protein